MPLLGGNFLSSTDLDLDCRLSCTRSSLLEKNTGICSFSARSQYTRKETAGPMLLIRPIDIDMLLTKEKSIAGHPLNKLVSYLWHLFFVIISNYKIGINV